MYKTFYIFIFVFCFGFGQNEDFVSDVHENYFFEGEYTLMEEIERYKFEQDSLKQLTLKFGNRYGDGVIFFLDVNESENNLYILNNSKDSLLYSDMLGHRIITEAKDESNNWVPITYIYYPEFVCGNSLSYFLLPNTCTHLV